MNLWIPDILRAIAFGRQFLKESKSKYFLAIAEEWMILNCTSQMQFITRKIDHPPVPKKWDSRLSEETDDLRRLLGTYTPPMVFTFGAFAFEFARRSLVREPMKSFGHWTTRKLGAEFKRSVTEFSPREVNVFPLLHASIARGHFLKSHEHFTGEPNGNYFDLVGREIGKLLLQNKDTLSVWVGPQSATR